MPAQTSRSKNLRPNAHSKAGLISVGLSFVIILGTLSGCSNSSSVRIGFAGELTGKQSDLGVQGRNGAQLAAELINASGGIKGRPVELLVRDDLGTPAGAQAADRDLIAAKVVAIIGHMSSGQTLAGLEVTAPASLLLFSPTASSPELSGRDDLFFRVAPTPLSQAAALARRVARTRGLQRLALLYDTTNAAYTEPYVQAFTQAFEGEGEQVVSHVAFTSTEQPDPAPLVTRLQANTPDGILLIASALDTALLAQQIRQRGLAVPLFASGWAQTDTLLQNGGQAVEGMEIVIAYDTNSSAASYQAFKTRYEQKFGNTPTFASGQSYEALQVLAAALQQTNGQAKGLKEALLAAQDYEGLIGKISFDPFGDVLRPLFLLTIRNGEYVTTDILAPSAP